MPKEKSAKEVYDACANKGEYEEAGFDKEETKKIVAMAIEDHEYARKLAKEKNPNYRVVFNIEYDALREICSALLKLKKQKISNHQGLFAAIIILYPELELDFNFFEKVRTIRNQNKYVGTDITKEKWDETKLQIDVYINSLKKEIEKVQVESNTE